MNQAIDPLKERRIQIIAEELAQHGLGICVPHSHDERGNIVPLPKGQVSFEKDLKVSFCAEGALPHNTVAVGWRWCDGALVAFAHCCRS